ncbi:AMP-binding protein, partial [Pseudomonas aeruginosa]|uniref:AMP-binding protein n=1 Tax=Pseudomonas aeruginosa TaxID=287 RepID=UPI002E81DC0B
PAMNHQNKKEKVRLRIVSTHDNDELPDFGVATIDELLHRSAARSPGAPAISALGVDVSYEALQNFSAAIATWLIDQGLQTGARVAVALPNMLAHPVACLGIIRAGLTAVCVNPLYTAEELVQIFKDSDVR